jgi:acyl carrier protein
VIARAIAGETRLVAYVTASAGALAPDALSLRQSLGASLPEYMIPSAFVALEQLPLTLNGKLDRRALPEPLIAGEGDYVAPSSPQEALLCQLFGELTGAARVSVEDHFFGLGGHSLLAMRLIARIRQETGFELGLRAVFETPTPRALAARLQEAGEEADEDTGPKLVPGMGVQANGALTLSWSTRY